MGNRQERLEQLFWQASQIDSKAKQNSFLQEACGDDSALLDELQELLGSVTDADKFLETCELTIPQVNSAAIGETIGPYKLREKIGEGGFGIVYVAEQRTPIHRKVALKLIKPGMDSQQIVARFETERQALALMDHPNIARVLDAGSTNNGRPYFVMELVNGVPITKFAESQQLTIDERLNLMKSVCDAVEHAHQKGIIHRDLKPSNVLVTLHDGKPVVKVIDFGVAKALHQKLTKQTVYTALGHVVGTPMYMSPEQAEMSGLDIDTRSDVYSLGVLLYELLAGLTPFDRDSFKKVGVEAMLRMIRESEPPRPSLRVSTAAKERTTIEDPRQLSPDRLSASLRGELDWIVMKTLEKQRERRYQSARELGQDLENYLADKPVTAGPPSSLYRFRKIVRRHRLTIATAAAVLLSMFAGTGVSVWYSLKANKAQRKAQQSEQVAQERLVLLERNQRDLEAERAQLRDEKQKLEVAQQQSERRFTLAKQAVSELVADVATHKLSVFPELADFRESLLVTADLFYTRLAMESPDDDSIYVSRAEVRRLMNRFTDSLEDYKKAAAINPARYHLQLRLSDFYRNTNGIDLRNPERALQHAKRAVELAPEHKGGWVLLAWAYAAQMHPESVKRAAEAMRRAAELTESEGQKAFHLGNALEFEGDFETAAVEYLRAAQLGSERPFHPPFRRGCCLIQMKQYDGAIESLDQSLQLDAFQPLSYKVRADAKYALHRYAEAAKDLHRAYELIPQQGEILPRLLECHLRSENHAEAVKVLKTVSGETAEKNGLLSPELIGQIKNTEHAELKAVHERLIDEVAARFRQRDDYLGLAVFYEQRGFYTDAAAAFDQFESHRERKPNAERDEQAEAAAEVAARLAERFRDDGEIDKAIRLFREAVEMQPNQAKYRIRLGMTLRWRAATPEDHEAEAIELFRSAVELEPKNFAANGQLARALATAKDPGLRNAGQAIFHAEKRLEVRPHPNSAYGLANLAMAHYRAGNWKKAIEICLEAQQAEGKTHAPLDLFLAMAYSQLNESKESERWYNAALTRIDGKPASKLDRQILDEARELFKVTSTN